MRAFQFAPQADLQNDLQRRQQRMMATEKVMKSRYRRALSHGSKKGDLKFGRKDERLSRIVGSGMYVVRDGNAITMNICYKPLK